MTADIVKVSTIQSQPAIAYPDIIAKEETNNRTLTTQQLAAHARLEDIVREKHLLHYSVMKVRFLSFSPVTLFLYRLIQEE